MRLRHIEVFHAIMQAGTISGAAQLLHISQPAVTKVLQHCELQLGLPLFDRVRGKLYPTPEAHRLFVEIDKLNRDLVSIRRLAASLRSGESERVRLVATPTLGAAVIPAAMTRWCAAFPDSHCSLATHHTREIVSALLLGEADLALSLQDPHHPGIKAEVLASGAMMALCPLGSPEAAGVGPLSVNDIQTELIGLGADDPLSDVVQSAAEAQGRPLHSRLTVQTYQLARALVEAGVGMTVVDPFTAASADRSRLSLRPLAPAVPVHLYLLSAANAPLAQTSRRLVKYLGEAARLSLESLAP
ncbi:LysR family transcriptional regulator [Paucibacter sp. KCTC 42545]|uniref:LysR family transcriptional regulator n=1 Tax=Paucibacter sp. KCTC 42545 TaxID=1768242 RepID=UPI000733B63F|nr:LysR substrate-binding domain-containing protein [Paucibacter sp. KCTC 42545]ALT79028.1 transcriptional regulator [Paucibacter sp. KCTC 42545]